MPVDAFTLTFPLLAAIIPGLGRVPLLLPLLLRLAVPRGNELVLEALTGRGSNFNEPGICLGLGTPVDASFAFPLTATLEDTTLLDGGCFKVPPRSLPLPVLNRDRFDVLGDWLGAFTLDDKRKL